VKLHDLKPDEGSRKPAKRVGRGIGGKGGKTAGRGHKGQHARNTVKPGFEGGQTPLTRRIPKGKGFKNPFRVEYQGINLDTIAGLEFAAGSTVDPDALRQRGLVHKHGFVKILGRGELTTALHVKAHGFTKTAEAAITGAGGTVERIPLPFKVRPAAKGNALQAR
jgi:large subunit ribosomal protein L15